MVYGGRVYDAGSSDAASRWEGRKAELGLGFHTEVNRASKKLQGLGKPWAEGELRE